MTRVAAGRPAARDLWRWPALLAPLLLDGGGPGWLVLGAIFAGTGLAVPALTRWALGGVAASEGRFGAGSQSMILSIP